MNHTLNYSGFSDLFFKPEKWNMGDGVKSGSLAPTAAQPQAKYAGEAGASPARNLPPRFQERTFPGIS